MVNLNRVMSNARAFTRHMSGRIHRNWVEAKADNFKTVSKNAARHTVDTMSFYGPLMLIYIRFTQTRKLGMQAGMGSKISHITRTYNTLAKMDSNALSDVGREFVAKKRRLNRQLDRAGTICALMQLVPVFSFLMQVARSAHKCHKAK